MFWENFAKLCNENDTTPNAVATAVGFSNAICTKWKSGTVPKGKTLNLLAEYFNVSVDYLLTGENKKSSSKAADEWYSRFENLNAEHQTTIEQMMRAFEIAEKIPPEDSDG